MTLAVLALLVACNPEDPCSKYDTEICGHTEGCSVFSGFELNTQGTGWCIPLDVVSGPIECMTTPDPDCEAGNKYAAPADEDGNPTDTCYAYTGCQPPQGWVDCTAQPTLDLEVCDV